MTAKLTGLPDLLILLVLTHRRRKGRPTEVVGVSASFATALVLAAEIAKRRKVPQSWIDLHYYGKTSSATEPERRAR